MMKKYIVSLLTLCPITAAFAQHAGGSAMDSIMQFLPIVAIFGIFYFLMIRPQQKKMKQHREMLSNIRRGDRIVTAGGIIGSVVKVDGDEVQVEISDGVKVRVVQNTIGQVLNKTAPVSEESSAEKPTKKSSPGRKTK